MPQSIFQFVALLSMTQHVRLFKTSISTSNTSVKHGKTDRLDDPEGPVGVGHGDFLETHGEWYGRRSGGSV